MTAYEFVLKMKNYATSELQKVSAELGITKTKAEQAGTSLSNIGKSGISLKGVFTGLIATLGTVGIGVGFMKLNDMLHEGIEKAHALHAAEAQVKAGLESTGGAAGVTYEMMEKSAKKFSSEVLYGRSQIMDMQAQMLSFGGLTKANFDKIQMAIMNVATRTGTDLHSMSIQFGKAMDNPADGVKKLQRQGVLFSHQQQEAIEKLVNKGNIVAAQQIMLTEIANKYGGSAQAAFNADPLAKYNKVVGGIKVAIGDWAIKIQSHLAPTMVRLAGLVKTAYTKVLDFSNKLYDVGTWISSHKSIFIGLGLILGVVGSQFLIASAGSIAYSFGIGLVTAMTWLSTAAFTALNFVISITPIGWLIIGIGALIITASLLWNKLGWLRGTVLGLWAVMKGFASMIKDYVINRFKELLSGITGIGSALVAFFNGDWQKAWDIGKKAGKDLLGVGSAKGAFEDAKKLGGLASKGWNEGMKDVTTPKEKKVKKAAAAFSPITPGLDLGDGETSKDKKDKADKKTKGDGIISGGSKQTNITITIGKLNEKIEVYTTNLKEGGAEIEKQVNEILLRAVNSVNQMQTN